jgi:riboflavin-specific deaminase-like protein
MTQTSLFEDDASVAQWQRFLSQVHAGGSHLEFDCAQPAGLLEELYQPLCQPPGQPWVVAQMGQSLDGRIALPNGTSRGLNGIHGEAHLHRLRALVDAVVVGSRTAEVDDPQLTVRAVAGPNPVRVIVDRHNRLPNTLRVFQDQAAQTLQVVAKAEHSAQLVVPELLDSVPGVAEQALLAALRNLGLHRVLIEGGGQTVSRFLQAGLVDRLHVMVAPVILGSGCPAFSLSPIEDLAQAWQGTCRRFVLGQDTLFDIDLRGS